MTKEPIAFAPSRTRVLAEVCVLVALAIVLNALRLYTLPQGGSITVGEMVPILLLALRRGVRTGMLAGAIFGIIDVYFEPYAMNPVQFLLDYPLAFGALGVAGFFRTNPLVGVGAGVGSRFVLHFISGIVFFAINAPSGGSPALYSAIYNATYLIPGLAISEFVILVLAKRGALKFRL